MRFASHSIRRRTIFCGEAGARRVDDDHVGLAGLLDQRADRRCGRRRRGSGRWRSRCSSALSLGVGDRLGDDLDAPDLAGARGPSSGRSCRSRRRGRRRARCRSGPAHSAAIAVEALGHLGVGLEEGAVGDAEAQAAELLLQVLGAQRPGGAVGAAASRPRRPCAGPRAGGGSCGRRGDQAGLDLAGAAALADDEVAQDAAAGRGGRTAGIPCVAGPVADLVAGGVVALRGEQAVLDVDDLGPSGRGRGSRAPARPPRSPKEYSSLLR